MLDIKFVRENPDVVKENIRKKFQDQKIPMVDEVIALDQENRNIKQEVESLRANKNKISKQIGALMAQGKKEEAEEVNKEVAASGAKIDELSAREKEVEEAVIIEETKEEFKPIFSWEDFEKLSDEAQNQLTSIAYENYLSETESRDNKTNRGIFEKAKKSLILKLSDKYLELKKDDKKDSQCVFATFDDYNSINYTINSIKNSFVEEFSPSHVKIMEETINFKSGIKYKKYSSMAKFVVEVYLIVKKKNTEITMEDFGSVLKIFEEYEDNYVHAIYNTSENIGGYMLK